MSLLSFLFETHIETTDHHTDPRLKTKYYKTTKSKLMEACREWVNRESWLKIIDQSDERGEIVVQVNGKRKGFLVLTVISTGPLRTAVDLSFTVDRGLNFGYGQSLCEGLYKGLGRTYEQVG